jgi:signal recognition particle receptor subunit beta
MSSINLHTKEITVKVVYYGPGLGGKTTSLQCIHRTLKPEMRGQLVSLATGIDRTLYFDFLPIKLPKVKDFTIRMSLYTVPGQVHYNATRKLVLQGADGVVFVADSQNARKEANIESVKNLDDNLRAHGMNPNTVPLVMEYNKRDLGNILSVKQLEKDLNRRKVPAFESCALNGKGIFEALRTITKLVLSDLKRKGIYQGKGGQAAPEEKKAPVVSPKIEEGLVKAFETRLDEKEEPLEEVSQPVESRGLTFSELWVSGPGRDQILAMEGDIERGDHKSAIRRAEGLLHEYVGQSTSSEDVSTAEALLMLGVHGPHYERFKNSISKVEPLKLDALYCLFFLADIQLRMQAANIIID